MQIVTVNNFYFLGSNNGGKLLLELFFRVKIGPILHPIKIEQFCTDHITIVRGNRLRFAGEDGHLTTASGELAGEICKMRLDAAGCRRKSPMDFQYS